ncbi:Helix-turn-helix domain-containing protein [Loktanella fryxellensis]|uniref:Helix-turn-helix domain-containing protein n=1 Tax=Loktanella fryxellensis TaxID=245187 RepID=A0A1H7YRF7_9RHOB|nr:helix-turn-helix domain-containing protein [Loktanella fryxellensis]SEM48555.1 Helix-turn-helix domain-containing protein [Loktanella fryxellensis]
MIVKSFRRAKAAEDTETKGFDAFDMRLGDMMRGERATMGKSLLDVQRELKIKAAYIAAIENADPAAFDTPGFIAGYVRSYARYLQMDPDVAFETFCRESGFSTAHGMSAAASSTRAPRADVPQAGLGKDIFSASATPFVPRGERLFSGIEPGAIGSILVLVALIGGLGYGGWSVLQEVQKVRLAPVDQTPVVLSNLDPLAGGGMAQMADAAQQTGPGYTPPTPEALDRLYRPQALDVPVLVARDAPISTLMADAPSALGLAGVDSGLAQAVEDAVIAAQGLVIDTPGADGTVAPGTIRVSEGPVPEVQLVAVRPAWVRVRAADESVIFEGIMNAGDTFALPATEEPATLRVGESGAVYFAVNGQHYGPAGPSGQVTSNLALSADNLTTTYQVADLGRDGDLAAIVNVAEVAVPAQTVPGGAAPQVPLAD